MAIKKVYFTENSLRNIRDVIRRYGDFKEVGGCIVGCQYGEELLVTHASDPGKRAKMQRYSIVIDNIHTTKFANSLNEIYDKKLYFIGDWHTHLSSDLRPSSTDFRALKSLNNYVPKAYKNLMISVIVNHFDSSQIKVYRLSSNSKNMEEVQFEVVENPDWLISYI
ncbi:hypothetical protein ACOQFO_12920 [Ureibacillus sp. MALMAid1270]|uniref:hypothetical protein n=1 Tax=Ureibacillus sp. MALMAid1270 TaxID=3411629 RepID=UPI003BA6C5BE